MKLAFSTISCPEYSIERIGKAVAEFGYDGVELYGLAGERLTSPLLNRHLSEFRRSLEGVAVVSMTAWAHLGMPERSAESRATDEAEIAAIIDLAATFGSPFVKVFGGELPPEPGAREVTLDQMVSVLERACEHAAKHSIGVNIETHDTFASAAVLSELLALVPSDWPVGVIWDIQHPHRMGESVERVDDLIGDKVRHVHVKDAVLRDGKWRHVLLGQGELPVEGTLSALSRRGFDGCVSLDWGRMWSPEIETADVALPQYAAGLRPILAALR